MLGSLVILRRQALVGDVVAHSALPGAVLVAILFAAPSLTMLLAGATVTAIIGAGLVNAFSRLTGPSPRTDAAMAVTLASLFGLGILLASIPRSDGQMAINAYRFILGQPASIVPSDLITLGAILIGVTGLALATSSRWQAWLIDPLWSPHQGAAPIRIDAAVQILIGLALVCAIPIAGVVLAVAGVILPPLIVRPFARTLGQFAALSAFAGGLLGASGVLLALMLGDFPTGPVVVLLSCTVFAATLTWRIRQKVNA